VKKKVALLFMGLAVITCCLMFWWPLSLTQVISDDASLFISIVDINLDGGKPLQLVTNYNVEPESEEFLLIRQALGRYSYHRSWCTLFNSNSQGKHRVDYFIVMLQEGAIISTGGTGQIEVNARQYRLGYWGNKTNIHMMNEIRGVLEQ